MQHANCVTLDAISPVSGSGALTVPPEVKVWAHGISSPDATVRFYRRETPPAVRPDFTVVVLPDTQFYTGAYGGQPPPIPEIFNSQTDWIVANRETRNIVFVGQVGDLVLRDSVESEWVNAVNAMSRLENPITTKLADGIPYSISVGNHDGMHEYENFNHYFGISRFAGRSYYGGHHGTNNTNHYTLFSASGMDFLVLSLEFEAGGKPAVMEWANAVLAANPNRRAMVLSHSMLYPGGAWNPSGLQIYEALKGNPNLFLMHCGHDPQVGRRTDTFNGNSVTTLLSDYTNEPNGGNGWLRLIKFVPSANQIQVKTYSPWLDQYMQRIGYDEFTISYNMANYNHGYLQVHTVEISGDGIVSAGVWDDLSPSKSYDWYFTVDESGQETRSQTWTFTTASTFSPISYPPPDGGIPIEPLRVLRVLKPATGHPAVLWRSAGGRRYRVEWSNGTEFSFTPIVRSQTEETDPAPAGSPSYQFFVDDGSLTDGPADSRFYRIREIP